MQNAQALPHTLYRGEHMPNIVQTLKVGNSTVHIATDYILSGEALEKAYDDFSQANYAIWDKLSQARQLEIIKEEEENAASKIRTNG